MDRLYGDRNSSVMSHCSSTSESYMVRPDSVMSGSDDSMCSARMTRGTHVARFATDARAALDRIRNLAEPEALLEPSAEEMPRPGTPSTSIGVQLSGTVVRGLVPCSPAALSQALFVGDEIIKVNDKEVNPHNVAQLLGGDKPGHAVQLHVRRAKGDPAVQVVELIRADYEEVKLFRNLGDYMAHIRDGGNSGGGLFEGSGSAKISAAADQIMAILTSLQVRRQQHDMERIARVNDAYSNIMASVDDIYGAVKKMEGSYNNVWKRANRLLRECEKHQLDKTAVGGPLDGSHLQSPGPDALGLGSSDSHDLRSIIAAQAKEIEHLKGMSSMSSGGRLSGLGKAIRMDNRLDSVADMNPASTPATPTSSAGGHNSHPSDDFAPDANGVPLMQRLLQLEHENLRLRHQQAHVAVPDEQQDYLDPKLMQDMCGLCLPERQVAQDGWAQGSVGRGQQASPAYDQDALKRAPCPDPGAMFARVAHKQQEAFAAFPHRPAAPDISGACFSPRAHALQESTGSAGSVGASPLQPFLGRDHDFTPVHQVHQIVDEMAM